MRAVAKGDRVASRGYRNRTVAGDDRDGPNVHAVHFALEQWVVGNRKNDRTRDRCIHFDSRGVDAAGNS